MEVNLVVEGFKFMALGMATVFLFLILLIILMNVMSAVLARFFPEPKANAASVNIPINDNKKIIAAITAAISHHRQG
jgi:oxaloacetate decarboxylase gamma subunit